MIFPPQGGRPAAIFAPQGGTQTLGAPPQGEAYQDLPGITAGATLLDIDPSQYADADSVVDVSGNLAGTFTKSGTPTVVTRNGLSAIYFAASGDYLDITQGLISDLTGGLTLVLLAEKESPLPGTYGAALGVYDASSSATGRAGVLFRSNDEVYGWSNADIGPSRPGGVGPLVVAVTFNEAGDARYTYLDGSQSAVDSTDVDPVDMDSFFLGAHVGNQFTGWIYRALVINEELDSSAVTTLTDYLNGLWNFSAWADSTEHGNVGTSETDASVFYLPPNALAEDGDWLEVEWVTRRDTAGIHIGKLYFDSTNLSSLTRNTSGLEVEHGAVLVRTSSNTVRAFPWYRRSDGAKDYTPAIASSVDFTAAIQIKTTLQGASATDDLIQHYFRVRKHGASDALTIDVDATGGTTSGVGATLLADLTIPAGTLTEARPVAVAEIPVTKTGTAGTTTITLRTLDPSNTSRRIESEAGAESYLFRVIVWRVSDSAYRLAHGFVETGGTSDFEIEAETAVSLDGTDLSIQLVGADGDAGDATSVPAYTAHVRQVDVLDSSQGITSTGSTANLYEYTGTADEDGKGHRITGIGEWEASVNASAVLYSLVDASNTVRLKTRNPSAQSVTELSAVRTGATTTKAFGAFFEEAAADVDLSEGGFTSTDWSTGVEASFAEVDHDADDYTIHLAYTEALP